MILTDDQRAGRGRLDRTWQAPAGASLALSLLISPDRIAPHARGFLPLIAGLAMTRAISAQLGSTVSLKWPNDVLVGAEKICGILAEVAPNGAIVVGSGVNTAMTAEQAPVSTATSFAMHDTTADIDRLLHDYLVAWDDELARLRAANDDPNASGLIDRLSAACSTLGKTVNVHLPDGSRLVGEATAIASDGRLCVVADGAERLISTGDIVHVR